MLEALLQGKLSREQENMEDLLTSMVFGSFRRMPAHVGLLPFLRKSEDITGTSPIVQNDNLYSTEYEHYQFWPSWQEFDNVASCEPDVVIKLDARNEQNILILIEAKYHSGISSYYSEDETVSHQLAKEWLHLYKEAKKRNCIPWLIYLTTDMAKGAPKKDIEEAQKEIVEKCGIDATGLTISWLSWRVLSEFSDTRFSDNLQPPAKRDIGELAERLSLIYFGGISDFEPPPEIRYKFKDEIGFNWNFQIRQNNIWGFINDR